MISFILIISIAALGILKPDARVPALGLIIAVAIVSIIIGLTVNSTGTELSLGSSFFSKLLLFYS